MKKTPARSDPRGVSHAMRLFFRHYSLDPRFMTAPPIDAGDARTHQGNGAMEIDCDEEAVAAIRI